MTTINKADRLTTNSEIHVARLDGLKTRTLKKLYKKLGSRLKFPDYFGDNLDALADMLTDLTWLEAPNVILYIKNFEGFLAEENEENRNMVFEIFDEAVNNQIDEERSFEVIKVV